jgi:hypothetical protein
MVRTYQQTIVSLVVALRTDLMSGLRRSFRNSLNLHRSVVVVRVNENSYARRVILIDILS